MSSVNHFKLDSKNPTVESEKIRSQQRLPDIAAVRNKTDIKKTQEEIDTSIVDFYSTYDRLSVDAIDEEEYNAYVNSLSKEERQILEDDKNYYEITFENIGGLVMPIILQFTYEDGTDEIIRIPAEVWKMNNQRITKVFPTVEKVVEITLDPYQETADTDTSNNFYPPKQQPSKFELFKQRQRARGQSGGENPMQRAKRSKVIKP